MLKTFLIHSAHDVFFLIDLWYVDVTNIIYQSFTEKHM